MQQQRTSTSAFHGRFSPSTRKCASRAVMRRLDLPPRSVAGFHTHASTHHTVTPPLLSCVRFLRKPVPWSLAQRLHTKKGTAGGSGTCLGEARDEARKEEKNGGPMAAARDSRTLTARDLNARLAMVGADLEWLDGHGSVDISRHTAGYPAGPAASLSGRSHCSLS